MLLGAYIRRLLHLRVVELVADVLTKPLSGQAVETLLADLGMRRDRNEAERHDDGPPNAAIAAMMTGSLLLSGMDARLETTPNQWPFGAVELW